METRTIFFSGPKGHRSVTCPVPSLEKPPPAPAPPIDKCAADRKRFFGTLNAMRAKLAQHGVTVDDMRQGYARIFGVKRMRHLPQELWAIAAAEVQAMLESEEIFLSRIDAFKPEPDNEFFFFDDS